MNTPKKSRLRVAATKLTPERYGKMEELGNVLDLNKSQTLGLAVDVLHALKDVLRRAA